MQVARPMTGVYKGARYGHKLRLEQCPLLFSCYGRKAGIQIRA